VVFLFVMLKKFCYFYTTGTNVWIISRNRSYSRSVIDDKQNGLDGFYPTSVRCKICLMAKVEVLFVPCLHLVSCIPCALTQRPCCVCRTTFDNALRVFLCTKKKKFCDARQRNWLNWTGASWNSAECVAKTTYLLFMRLADTHTRVIRVQFNQIAVQNVTQCTLL